MKITLRPHTGMRRWWDDPARSPGQPPPAPVHAPLTEKEAARRRDQSLAGWLTVGLALIGGWFVATRTTLLFAYRAGTLAQVQSLCDSTLGRVARDMTTTAASNCAHADSLAMWLNLAGITGVLLVIGVAGYALLARH